MRLKIILPMAAILLVAFLAADSRPQSSAGAAPVAAKAEAPYVPAYTQDGDCSIPSTIASGSFSAPASI